MVEFIICDDNEKFLHQVEKIVDEVMISNNLEYKIKKFNDYDEKFMKEAGVIEGFRIYILDIETPSRSGINIAHLIRMKDLESVIIFVTGHEELGHLLLRKDLLFLSFINKFDDFKFRLLSSLRTALRIVGCKSVLEIEEGGIVYRLRYDNILYITRDSIDRKIIVVTDYGVYRISKTLNEVIEQLDTRFIKTHRSCFINEDRVIKKDYKTKEIVFDNNVAISLLSGKYKEGEEVDA